MAREPRLLEAGIDHLAAHGSDTRFLFLSDDPLDWPWSSARAHAGLEQPRIPLAESDLRRPFGASETWRRRYRSHIEAGNEKDPPKRAFLSSGGRI